MHAKQFALIGVITIAAQAAAQPVPPSLTTSVSVGLRAFVNRVSGAGYTDVGVPGASPIETAIDSQTAISMLPSLTIRYGVLVFNASYHAKTSYDIVFDVSERYTNRRTEWDASIGFSVLPNLVVSVGQKSIDVVALNPQQNPSLSQKTSGPFVGLSTSATLAGPWAVYGSFAYGRPKFELEGRRTGTGGQYLASEFGLRLELGALSPSLRGAGLLAGYRTQALRFSEVPFSYFGPASDGSFGLQKSSHGIRQGIDGLTLGMAYTF